MSDVDERSYRDMVEDRDAGQVDAWAADLFMDFAKRMGVGTAIASFCRAAGLDEGRSGPGVRRPVAHRRRGG